MTFALTSAIFVPTAAAFVMPPREVQIVVNEEHIQKLPSRVQRSIQIIHAQPSLSGLLRTQGAQILGWGLQGGWAFDMKKQTLSRTQIDFSHFEKASELDEHYPHPQGHFALHGSRLRYMTRRGGQELWALELGQSPDGFERAQGLPALLGFVRNSPWRGDVKPTGPRLFVLSHDLQLFNRIDWQSQGELVAFVSCDRYQHVVIENHPQGPRFLYFNGAQLQQRAQLLPKEQISGNAWDVTGVVAKSCLSFYVSGAHGLAHVQF